ncbi:MAG TPA: hypothetical protein VFL13_10645 [Candidatus Baltobacteraceae bacterium]|nr:hypothetical protein [Candidatus Baltobacteraceae bacterium]
MAFWMLVVCAAVMAIVQEIVPGRPLYHYGWYNALDAALIAAAMYGIRKRTPGQQLAVAGAGLIALAGIASGLMGPDTQTIVGAPGATIETADFGAIRFPLDASGIPARRYGMQAIFTAVPRDVVHVTASDAKGNHLTLTQPTGATFLSPVLLMQQTAQIAGRTLRTDEFSLPAVARSVKAVYFTPAQIADMHPPGIAPGSAAVLFDMTDSKERAVPHGLNLIASGTQGNVGGVVLRPDVEVFPAIEAASAPMLPLVLIGLVVLFAGAAQSFARRKMPELAP